MLQSSPDYLSVSIEELQESINQFSFSSVNGDLRARPVSSTALALRKRDKLKEGVFSTSSSSSR